MSKIKRFLDETIDILIPALLIFSSLYALINEDDNMVISGLITFTIFALIWVGITRLIKCFVKTLTIETKNTVIALLNTIILISISEIDNVVILGLYGIFSSLLIYYIYVSFIKKETTKKHL